MNRLLVATLLGLAPLVASAAAVCRLGSGSGLAFGPYDVLARPPRDSQVTLTLTCEGSGTPQNVLVSVGVDQGTGGTSVASRRMLHTGGIGAFLGYGLYRDPARSSVWGLSEGVDTMTAAIAVPAAGVATARFTIYGRIPAGQDLHAGSYADSVQVTVNY